MRQSHDEIDARIIETAAGLFAVHGFDRTSVQQVADAVGYSKTGLLHRFPSKQALLDAVTTVITEAVADVSMEIAAVPDDQQRTRRVLQLVTATALAHPGGVRFLLQQIHLKQEMPDDVLPAKAPAESIVDVLAGPDPSPQHLMRVILGLELICSGAVRNSLPEHGELGAGIGPLLVDLAAGVIGSDVGNESRLTSP